MATEPRSRVQRPPDGRERDCTVRIASQPAEVKAALKLVHRTYLRCCLTRPNQSGMRVTPYHLLPTTELFIALDGQEVTCTLTLIRDGTLGLPMETIYGEEIAVRRRARVPLAEVSCLAQSGQSLAVVVRAMSLMAQCARRRGVDELVITVHPDHTSFYERFIGFRRIGRQKIYQSVCGNPAEALSLDLKRLAVIHPVAYKRFFGRPFPEEELRYRPISNSLHAELRRVVERCGCGTPLPEPCQRALKSIRYSA